MQDFEMSYFKQQPYVRRTSGIKPDQLLQIDQQLQQLLTRNDDSIKRTHYFNDRYENLYVRPNMHPLLEELMKESVSIAAEIAQVDHAALKIGFWFNLMQPGQSTTLHRHDDLDEIISGVIYLKVPRNSGDLLIYHAEEKIVIEPRAGNYIFFDPKTPHEVTENRSSDYRLSIGMNIGIPEHD